MIHILPSGDANPEGNFCQKADISSSRGMLAGGNKAVNIAVRVLKRFLMILEIAVIDLIRDAVCVPFAQHISGGASLFICVALDQEQEEYHFICHAIHPLYTPSSEGLP